MTNKLAFWPHYNLKDAQGCVMILPLKYDFSRHLLLITILFCLATRCSGNEADIFTRDHSKEESLIKDLLQPGEFIRDSASTEDGKSSVYLIFRNENGGSNYVCLITVTVDEKGQTKRERRFSSEILRQKEPLCLGIIELGKIDTKTFTIAVRVGITSSEDPPYTVTYKWQELSLK